MRLEKFTKGPWKVVPESEDGAVVLCGSDVNPLSGKDMLFMNEKVYDAHLIAASPEMYDMLKECRRILHIADGTSKEILQIDEILKRARGE